MSYTVGDFHKGMRVRHVSMGAGTVTLINGDCVHVLYDTPSPRGMENCGIYDEAWFRGHDALSPDPIRAKP